MAKHLTDKEKKQIIKDYIECQSYNAVATKYGISNHTVKRVVLNNQGTAEKIQQKKEQNTADILAFMESKKYNVTLIIDRYLDALLDESKIARSSPQALATALGIIIDKFTAGDQKRPDVTLFATIAQASGGFKHE